VDTWTGRAVERAPLSNEALARARAFAAADHRSLQTVLRVDRAGGVIWLAATKPRPGRGLLTEGECAQLSDALGALHAAGIAHGHVDAEHVAYGEDGCSVLRFAVDGAAGATPERDREALAQMAGRRPVQR
jgi:serine/threonine-protein kinase